MTPNDLTRFIHPEDPSRLNGGLRLRLALLQLTQEVTPEADDAVLVVDQEIDYSSVRFTDPPARMRWPGWPRAFVARERLGRVVANVFPGIDRAGVFFFKAGELIGYLKLPVQAAP